MALDFTCFATRNAKRRSASSAGVGWRFVGWKNLYVNFDFATVLRGERIYLDRFWNEFSADPAKFGGDPADAFTVVAPSLPGYGLSFAPNQKRA